MEARSLDDGMGDESLYYLIKRGRRSTGFHINNNNNKNAGQEGKIGLNLSPPYQRQ